MMMYPSAYMSYPAHFPPNNDPRAREIPFHMKMDHPYHQPWPCYPIPHGCCNHGCYGGGGGPYTFPHYPPPFSGAYPAYSTPPPHYSVEQPRYDYDKYNPVPHPKVETKTSEPLVPLFLKDSPYPIMWVPSPANSNNENDKKPRMEPEVVDKKSDESLVPLFLKDSPYPIMWVPPSVYMNQDSKHSNDPVSFKDTEEPINRGENGEGRHLPFPIFWLPSKNTEVGNDTKDDNHDLVTQKRLPDENRRHDSDSEMRSKHVPKVIPVKQVAENLEKKSEETKTESEKKDKASPKASKLPPVCLRIEPLPRKKTTSSRSPSPPGEKDRFKSSQQETHIPENLKEGEKKTAVVTTDANKLESSGFADLRENGKVDEKKNLSEKEAALMIQSAYRGFEVRKSQPLMKLRQIGEVTKQGVEVRNRIQDMESSSSAVGIAHKQKLAIGETIMSLLLKLDTIQGLHPIVRDVRKSVAKELVGLQEKLDSLTSINSETPIGDTVFSDKQVTHPKDDVIEKKFEQSDNNVPLVESGSGLSGSCGVDSKDSHDDSGLEACNTNIELRKEGIVGEQSHKQPVDVVQHKFDQAVTEFESTNEAVGSVSNCGVESFGIKPEQIQMSVEADQPLDDVQVESDSTNLDVGLNRVIFENQDFMDSNTEGARDIRTEQNTKELNSDKHVETEQRVDGSNQEKSNEMQAELGVTDKTLESVTDTCEKHEAKNAESDVGAIEAGDISFKQHDESESQHSIIIPETEQTVKQEKVEDKECKDVIMVEKNVELPKEDATEEAPKVHDFETETEVVEPANGGDRKLMEENQELRLTVEELLSQQSSVIRELKRKVEDLEKKLSKKNKKTKVNKCKSRGFVVQDVI